MLVGFKQHLETNIGVKQVCRDCFLISVLLTLSLVHRRVSTNRFWRKRSIEPHRIDVYLVVSLACVSINKNQ